ncbi:MAG TPA: ATP synthase F1 subunit delta [Clostridiaceae bacterium]|nr:ATP synthase F1 subunit delta [Clostridiaceae bacterium]
MAQIEEHYAQAFFEISTEKKTSQSDLEQALFVEQTLNTESALDFLLHPSIKEAEKLRFLENTYGETVSTHMMGLLSLMLRKHREEYIVPTLNKFIEMVNRHSGRIKARVVSAIPLRTEQIESIRTMLSKQMNAIVDIETEIDPDVIGGFYILAEGKIFDGTVRSQLNKMKNVFYKGSMKAKIVSASALNAEQLEAIRDTLSRKVDMKVELKTEVDPHVIGGYCILIDGRVFDRTVKSELDNTMKLLQRGELNGI